MALGPRLELRQSQSLVMTPQLQQAIKLLQLSSLELTAYVEAQLEQNPLLEREGSSEADGRAAADGEALVSVPDGDPIAVDEAVGGTSLDIAEASLDFEMPDNVFDDDRATAGGLSHDGSIGSREKGGNADDGDVNLENRLAQRPTLKDHLWGQVVLDIDDPVDRLIAAHLIDLLDDAGYLTGEPGAIADLLGCAEGRVASVLARLQRFDPPGIFARTLAECLRLQLHDRDRLDRTMACLLDHLDLVGRREWGALCRLCEIDGETLNRALAEIRSLNPKPALIFDYAEVQPVIPDIFVRPRPKGGWAIELNSDALPRVLVNNRYYAVVSRAVRSKAERQYISECLQSANWLVKALHQRATTILKVATEIVRRQEGFLAHGVQSLRPLVLRDIAEALGLHESTISRVTSNKFMATPRGIYELKFFFTHAVGGSNGDDAHSAAAVRHRLKALIQEESPDRILSDDALAETLQKEGIDIARRTVAKYREALGISSSVLRRREKSELR
ncbi:MAG: RNA polymerase factor sigma-54 [Defluviicoccus sp.]|nr:RNA polymerase factor sigma-54 [Defluviicoccus sp.]